MLDGPASESMSAPVGFRPVSNKIAFEPNNSKVAFERQPRKPSFERKSGGDNFSELPPHLMNKNNPQEQEDQPSQAEMELMQQIMSQAQSPKKSVDSLTSQDKPNISTSSTSKEKFNTVKPVQNKTETVGLKEKIKVVWEKAKAVAKKIWYYGSGSFIWDKIS